MTDATASPAASAPRIVRCPGCGGPSPYSPANAFRPFCSQRCKLQDLGAWASEQFRMQAQDDDAPDPASLPGPAPLLD